MAPVEEHQLTKQYLALFESLDEDGIYVYSDRDVRHLLPAIALVSGWQPAELADETAMAQVMEAFRLEVGLPTDADVETWDAAASSYYATHPPNAKLLSRLQKLLSATTPP